MLQVGALARDGELTTRERLRADDGTRSAPLRLPIIQSSTLIEARHGH